MPDVKDVSSFLTEQQKCNTGEIAQEWATLEDLYNKKYIILTYQLIDNHK